MSPVAISGVDKQGVDVNGVQVKQALDAANSTVNKGVYNATLLETVDADLAVGNIKSAVNIFGKVGTVVPMDVSDADALVTDVKDPKTFYSVAAPRKTGTMPTVAIVAANDNYPAGYHDGDAGGLDAIDLDLVSANIKSGVTIFGKAGAATVQDIADADLAVAEAPTGKKFYAVTGGVKTGTGTKTLSPANDTVAAGYYAATTLSAVDADLAAANIKSGKTIFGKAGAVIPQGTETIEKYSDATLASLATYTPAASGIFYLASPSPQLSLDFSCEYYSTAAGAWYRLGGYMSTSSSLVAFTAIGNGTNFKIVNRSGGNHEYILMRHYYSTGTYERARDEQLASLATWTPATAGFFSVASEGAYANYPGPELQFTTGGWYDASIVYGAGAVGTLAIGDGTNLRIKNDDGGGAHYHVTMRTKLI